MSRDKPLSPHVFVPPRDPRLFIDGTPPCMFYDGRRWCLRPAAAAVHPPVPSASPRQASQP